MEFRKWQEEQLKNDPEFKKEFNKLEKRYKRINKKIGEKMNRTRPKQIVIRATESEFETIKERVKKSKLKQNDYLLRAILNKKIIVIEGLPELTLELKRIGNNLNQITKEVHQGRAYCGKEVAEIERELNGAWQLLKQLTQKQV
jgi:transketolase